MYYHNIILHTNYIHLLHLLFLKYSRNPLSNTYSRIYLYFPFFPCRIHFVILRLVWVIFIIMNQFDLFLLQFRNIKNLRNFHIDLIITKAIALLFDIHYQVCLVIKSKMLTIIINYTYHHIYFQYVICIHISFILSWNLCCLCYSLSFLSSFLYSKV